MNIVATTPDGRRIRYDNFLSARVKCKMGQMAREFAFMAATRGAEGIPFYAGQFVEIYDGEDKLFTGWVERVSTSSDGKGHKFEIGGRDLMADVIDSNLPAMYDLRMPLPQICEYVLGFLGVEAEVIDEAGAGGRRLGWVSSPDIGDTAGEFLADVAKRMRALLQSDGNGNLVITDGIGTLVETELINRIDGVGNNLLKADFTIDQSQRFGRISSEHQLNMTAWAATSRDPKNLVGRRFLVVDDEIRPSRFKAVSNDANTLASDARQRPLWEVALNRAESIKYRVTVPGFRDWEDRLWTLNTAPIVFDEYNGIDGRMLISEIEYSFTGEGRRTKMVLTDREAFRAKLKIRKEFVNDGPPES